MELFHIHRLNQFDSDFHEGNTVIFGTEPNALRLSYMKRTCTMPEVEGIVDGKEKVVHRDLEDFMDYEKIAGLPKDRQIELLDTIRRYIHNTKIDNREIILEDVRRELFPDRVSRYTCAWLTDEQFLEGWVQELTVKNDPIEIYRVDIDGNLFMSSDSLLPDMYLPSHMMYNQAIDYWNPSPIYLNQGREYLLEGKMNLVERVR